MLPKIKNTASTLAMLQNSQVDTVKSPGLSIQGDLLRFRAGKWLIGEAKEELPENFEVVLNPASFKHGFQLWHESKLADSKLVPINEPAPDMPAPIGNSPPNVARRIEGVSEEGLEFTFQTSSMGGVKAVDTIMQKLFDKARSGSEFIYPLVELSSSSYVNKNYGNKTIYVPEFILLKWFDENQNVEGSRVSPEIIEPEEAPVRRKRRIS